MWVFHFQRQIPCASQLTYLQYLQHRYWSLCFSNGDLCKAAVCSFICHGKRYSGKQIHSAQVRGYITLNENGFLRSWATLTCTRLGLVGFHILGVFLQDLAQGGCVEADIAEQVEDVHRNRPQAAKRPINGGQLRILKQHSQLLQLS